MKEKNSQVYSADSTAPSLQADRYRDLFENSADAILIIEDDKFVDCNQAAVDMLRYNDKGSLLQSHPSELSPEFQPDGQRSFDKANEMMAHAVSQRSHRFEWEHVKADGEQFPVEVLLTALPAGDGFTLHTVWRDISARKHLETELRHSQKMEVVGKLAGGIAHDFNNLLVPILGYSDMLADALVDQPELQLWAQEIHRASTTSSILVNKLLAFSRKDIHQPVVLEIEEVVENLLSILGKLIGEDISVHFQGPEDALYVRTNPGDIEQIVLNLATNSRDAMPEGGEVKISLTEIVRSGTRFACLSLEDTGTGMDQETLEQLYVPFFTTKEVGSGTGLGMSTVHDLVSKAGGRIDTQSSLGNGTKTEVLFPIVDEGSCESAPEVLGEPGRAGVEVGQTHVLVVDDDAQVVLFVRRVLSRAGFRVSDVGSAAEAIEIASNDTPGLILTDVIMSKMSGPEMVSRLEIQGIKVPVVFMSGYTDNRLTAYGIDTMKISLVRKPFAPATLVSQVKAALASSAKFKSTIRR